MRSSSKMASRLSAKMFWDMQLVHDRQHTAGDALGLEDKADEKVEEINANYFISEVTHTGLGNEGMEKQEMMKEEISFKNEIVDKSHNPRVPESEWHGNDRDVDMVDDSPPERRQTMTGDVTHTTGRTKCVKFEKDEKDDDGGSSLRRAGRPVERNMDQEPAPCSLFWKRVRKFFGKHAGRVLMLIGMGALVLPPVPGSDYVPVQTRQVDGWSENENASLSYGMLLF